MNLLFLADVDDPAAWHQAIRTLLPDDKLAIYPEIGDVGAIDIALVAKPPQGVLGTLPNLKLICSLWAGVDKLLADPTLPRHLPLTRLIDPGMTAAMTETVLTHVLAAHRQMHRYRAFQARVEWRPLDQKFASERRVGILGLGELGTDAALKLKLLGFDVAGWSRRPKSVAGVTSYSGADGLDTFLQRTEILVNLLPLTDDTRGVLNAGLFATLPREAVLINVARGGHMVDADLIAALDSGQLDHAVLDVFSTEPLPADHPFWRHPKVTMTPHVAAATDHRTAAREVAETIRRFKAGEALPNRVDFALGY